MSNGKFGSPQLKYIAGAATTQVKLGPGKLYAIIVNTPVASSTINVIDNTAGSTTNLALITNTTDVKPYALSYAGLEFKAGLRIITSGADNLTIVYS